MYISCKKQSTNSADVSHVKRVWKIYRVTKFVIRWCFRLFCYFWGKFWVINDEYNFYNFPSCLKGLLIYVLKLSITRWNCPKCLFYLRALLFLCISIQWNILVNSFLIKKPKLFGAYRYRLFGKFLPFWAKIFAKQFGPTVREQHDVNWKR